MTDTGRALAGDGRSDPVTGTTDVVLVHAPAVPGRGAST